MFKSATFTHKPLSSTSTTVADLDVLKPSWSHTSTLHSTRNPHAPYLSFLFVHRLPGMHYLKLAPFFVYVALNNVALVSAAPRPLEQGVPVGGDTVGLVTPTFVPNVKLPGAATGSGGIPVNGFNSGKSSLPAAPKAAGVPGMPSVPGVPSTPHVPDPPHLPVPGLSSLPHRRSTAHDNGRLEPRQIHNADFATSPNSTIPHIPTANRAEATSVAPQKRGTKNLHMGYTLPTSSDAGSSDEDFDTANAPKTKRASRGRQRGRGRGRNTGSSGRPTRHTAAAPPQREEISPTAPTPGKQADKGSADSSSSSGPAGGLTDLVKTVGGVPKTVSPAVNSVPAAPDTPLTSADTQPTIDAAEVPETPPAAKVPVAVEEKESAPGDNAGAYPVAPGYGAPPPPAENVNVAAEPKTKRHSFVLDTDPLLPPDEATAAKKDSQMGFLNLDSNKKPDVPSKAPVPQNAAITPAPTSTDPAPTTTQSVYQPSEPGYSASYPTPTPVSG